MTPETLLALFDDVAAAVAGAVRGISGDDRRARTDRRGQYALDVVADEAALALLGRAPVAVVSEESGRSGLADAAVTVVLDPVDGSTNCARGISYWATSICALDGDGPVAALVVNQATASRVTAVRAGGAFRDGVRLRAATTRRVEDAVVALSGAPARVLGWKQFRALGCAALSLCDVAAGGLDAYLDGYSSHAPWDYLGGYLACLESGAVMVDARGEELATGDPAARRQLVAACTPELLDALRPATGAG